MFLMHEESGILVVSISLDLLLGLRPAPSGRALRPYRRTGFERRARGKCESRRARVFGGFWKVPLPAGKFSRPLRGARFPAEHAGA